MFPMSRYSGHTAAAPRETSSTETWQHPDKFTAHRLAEVKENPDVSGFRC